MSCLLLSLCGPAQSWGIESRFSIRDAGTDPSKSGVVGLLAAALGRARNEPIGDLASLRMGVRVDAEGRVQRDFHTALGAIRSDGSANKDAVVSTRYFLADAAFLVVLESDDRPLLDEIDAALTNPRWPLFLGRKAFVPTGPIRLGVVAGSVEDAFAAGQWTDPSPLRRERLNRRLAAGETVMASTITEVSPAEATTFRDDQPLSFEPRRFGRRGIRLGLVALRPELLGS